MFLFPLTIILYDIMAFLSILFIIFLGSCVYFLCGVLYFARGQSDVCSVLPQSQLTGVAWSSSKIFPKFEIHLCKVNQLRFCIDKMQISYYNIVNNSYTNERK